jgi:hypothetical protein
VTVVGGTGTVLVSGGTVTVSVITVLVVSGGSVTVVGGIVGSIGTVRRDRRRRQRRRCHRTPAPTQIVAVGEMCRDGVVIDDDRVGVLRVARRNVTDHNRVWRSSAPDNAYAPPNPRTSNTLSPTTRARRRITAA